MPGLQIDMPIKPEFVVPDITAPEWDRKAADALQTSSVIYSLAHHIQTVWQANKLAKNYIERRMLDNVRQRKGEYDPDVLARIRALGGSDEFIRITDIKCRALEGWLKDIMLPVGERPWGIDPTPVSDLKPDKQAQIVARMHKEYRNIIAQAQAQGQMLSPEDIHTIMSDIADKMESELKERVQEQARNDAKSTEDMVDDILKEAGWYKAVRAIIKDIPVFHTVFIEGPVVENELQLEWQETPDGSSSPTVVNKAKRKYYRLSPFDVYPAPGAMSCDDGDLIVKKRFTRSDLLKLKGVEGFDDDSINAVLDRYPTGYMDWSSSDNSRYDISRIENRQMNEIGTIDTLKYYGSAQGSSLLQWGMNPKDVPDPFGEYEILAYLVGDVVISAKINPHPLGKRGIHSTSYAKNNESIWGESLCDTIKDIQRVCNAAVRALVTNMGIASGPQSWSNSDAFEPGEDPTDMYPLKHWRFRSADLVNGVPMGFFQPESNADALIKVYDYFYKMASEVSGIPAYMYGGSKIGGAGDTALGLSMLMDAAGKAMKDVVSSIDEDIVVPTVEETWIHVMIYEPEKAKGDIKIIARASDYIIQKETLQMRRQEFLQITNNPTDLQITGISGRAEVLREVAGSLKLRRNKVVPEEEGLKQMEEQSKLMNMAQMISQAFGIPVEMIVQAAQGQPVQQQQALQASQQPGQGETVQGMV